MQYLPSVFELMGVGGFEPPVIVSEPASLYPYF